ncbi:MAG TPA: PRC-barrel domain-containing protein [Azospirillaceae bacterium]|nr:PRC-barrel domain-containing protein [Azospirillaceae bacterium]
MRKELIGAVSALALLSGAALAQGSSQGSAQGSAAQGQGPAPSATPAPTGSAVQPANPNAGTDASAAAQETGRAGTATSSNPAEGVGTAGTTESGKDRNGSAADSAPASSVTGASPGTSMAMDRASAEKLLGRTVVGAGGEEIGEVNDIVLDPQTGQARQLVISSGGFLGIGEKNVAVDFKNAQVTPGADQIKVGSLTQDQVKSMKEFEYDEQTVSLNRSGESKSASGSAKSGGSASGTGGSAGSSGGTGSTGTSGGSGGR